MFLRIASMLTDQNNCNIDQLVRLVEQELTPDETNRVESHLATCRECQNKLEALAGPESFWKGVAKRLGDVDIDGTTTTDCSAEKQQTALQFLTRILSSTDDPQYLGRIGSYEVKSLIGVGGMAIVVKAYDPVLSRPVAIKILSGHLATSGSARQRFLREAKAAAAVVHENVLDIHAIAEWNGLPYLVMPYVRGGSLAQRVEREGPLPTIEILQILKQIADGLNEAHEQAIIHRDIKPANILLEDQGSTRIKIADFGLARVANDASLTRSGTISGTPLFMSPEQARGDRVERSSDLFSLGSLAYVLCTGHPPFRAETPYGVIRRIMEEQPRPIHEFNSDVPDWLSRVVKKLMAKSPAERIKSASRVSSLMKAGLQYERKSISETPEVLKPFLNTSNQKFGVSKPLFALTCFVILIGMLMFSALKVLPYIRGNEELENSPLISSSDTNSLDKELPEVIREIDEASDIDAALERARSHDDFQDLRYEFALGEKYYYALQMVFGHPDCEIEIDGAIRLEVVATDAKTADIKYRIHLPTRVKAHRSGFSNPLGPSRSQSMMTMVRRCEKAGRARVSVDGGILGRSRPSHLPAQLGPVLDFVFPKVVMDVKGGATLSANLDLDLSKLASNIGPNSGSVDSVFVSREIRYKKADGDGKDDPIWFAIEIADQSGDDEFLTKGKYRFDPNVRQIDTLEVSRTATLDAESSFANVEFKLSRAVKKEQLAKIRKQFADSNNESYSNE